jgi:tRNA modification GTPase
VDSFDNDTIAALATPWGRGGIAVIRISGDKTQPILEKITEKFPTPLTPGKAYHSFIRAGKKRIDECVMVFFKAPHSYTGEDTAEISVHSNPFLVEEILDLIYNAGKKETRIALPGEFTYRAFKNGRMDLLQAESVNELINANSRYFAHMKFGTLEGKLSRLLEELKEELINLGVRIETKIEFEEDQFFEEIFIKDLLETPLTRLETLLSNSRFNEMLNKGLNVVIVGKVNVGKSSLFNTLLMEERSIISSIPGTTRDFIKEKIFIHGFPIELTDAAGINRETRDDIEAQGIQRSLEKIKHSDAVIFMLDASAPFDRSDKEIYDLVKQKNKLVVVNKLDIKEQTILDAIAAYFKEESIAHISVKEHTNIEAITGFFKGIINDIKGKETDFTINQRQKMALEELQAILTRVKELAATHSHHVEIMAEEIRQAVAIIGQLMGEITPDDILNKIFSQFCVGK